MVGGRAHAAGARRARRARDIAERDRRLARRHRRCRDPQQRSRANSVAGRASGRLRRLAAERSADQAGSLPDGAQYRRPYALSRYRAGGAHLSPAGRTQGQARVRQMAVAPLARRSSARHAALQPQARLHGSGGALDRASRRRARSPCRSFNRSARNLPPRCGRAPVRRPRRQADRPRRLELALLRALASPPHRARRHRRRTRWPRWPIARDRRLDALPLRTERRFRTRSGSASYSDAVSAKTRSQVSCCSFRHGRTRRARRRSCTDRSGSR